MRTYNDNTAAENDELHAALRAHAAEHGLDDAPDAWFDDDGAIDFEALAEHVWEYAGDLADVWDVPQHGPEDQPADFDFPSALAGLCRAGVEDDGVTIQFDAAGDCKYQRCTARSTRWQPAEHETMHMDVPVTVRFDPTEDRSWGRIDVEAC